MTSAKAGWGLPAALAVAVAVAAALKWGVYVMLGRALNLFESGTTIVGGIRMLSGQSPYTDFFSFYGPLSYLFPGLSLRLTGSITTADFGLDLVVSVLSVLVVYLVTVRITRHPVASLLAPAVVLLLGSSTARTLPALVSVLLLTLAESTARRSWFVLAGVAGGIGLLWIQDAGTWICVAVAIVTVLGFFSAKIRRVLSLRSFLLYAAGVAGTLLPWVIYALVRGSFGAWIYWSFIFPVTGYTQRSATGYFESLVASVGDAGFPRNAYILVFWVLPFFVIFAFAAANLIAAFVFLRRSGRPDQPIERGPATPVAYLVLAIYAALQLRVLIASVDEAKMLDSAAPTIAAIVVVVIVAWPARTARGVPSALARIGAVAIVAWLIVWPVWTQGRAAAASLAGPRPVTVASIGGLPFNHASPPPTSPSELDEVVRAITERTADTDGILVLPTSPLLYAAADRANPTRYDYLDPVYTTTDVDESLAAAVRSGEVKLVVLGDNRFPGSELSGEELAPQTYAAIDELFTEVASAGDFTVLAPR